MSRLIIMLSQPKLAKVGVGAELGNKNVRYEPSILKFEQVVAISVSQGWTHGGKGSRGRGIGA